MWRFADHSPAPWDSWLCSSCGSWDHTAGGQASNRPSRPFPVGLFWDTVCLHISTICGILKAVHHSPIKKNEIMPSAATWMDLGFMRVSEVSRSKTNIIYHLYVELKKFYKWIYPQNRNTHRHKKQSYGYERKWGGWWIGNLGLTDTLLKNNG